MDQAPLHTQIARGPAGGRAVYRQTADGLRLRLALWQPPGAQAGTVLLFQGRTEYAEKYGPAAAEFAAMGYQTLVPDWRGQGLSDRLLPDRLVGHIDDFAQYQHDVATMRAFALDMDLPRPWFVLGHSMGGCIALRALQEGLEARAVGFSAPMFGIAIHPLVRPLARPLGALLTGLGQGHRFAPGTGAQSYVASHSPPDNALTEDAQMYAFMRDQLRAHPELGLGGPSCGWVHAALRESQAVSGAALPALPCHCALGTAETIVDSARIRATIARWPGATLALVPGGRHEVMMETPPRRRQFYDALGQLFARAA